MIISRSGRFIFAAFNKTGSTSVEQALRRYDCRIWRHVLRWKYRRAFSDVQGKPFKHISPRKIRHLVGDAAWSQYFSFTFARNPWDRVVSLYFYQRQRIPDRHPLARHSFADYMRAGGSGSARRQMADFACDEDGGVMVDFIGRFETLETDFQKVCTRLGLAATLPHANPSRHGAYRRYYDDETREIVADWARRDIDMFGYEF